MSEINRLVSLSDILPEKGQVSAISDTAREAGLRDVYDRETKKRFVLSPDTLVSGDLNGVSGIVLPKLAGQVDSGMFAYEIPLNSVAKSVVSLENSSNRTVLWDPKAILKKFREANPGLSEKYLGDDYWTVGNGTLTPIFFEDDRK